MKIIIKSNSFPIHRTKRIGRHSRSFNVGKVCSTNSALFSRSLCLRYEFGGIKGNIWSSSWGNGKTNSR